MLKDTKKFLNSLPNKPGIYEMFDANGRVLYVGKAKNLKKRLQSYFRSANDRKTQILMRQVKKIETIVTSSENDAWLLESNLIKIKKPRYNILFKDDKSFPYLLLSKHNFPRLSIYRGATNKSQGKYFGPFPDRSAVGFIFSLVQKVFGLRVCKDSYMKNRSRPCMLHQIRLCSAPCKNHIDKKTYALQVDLVEKFLSGKNDYVVRKLTKLMDEAASGLDYEQAASYRDQIASIRKIQTNQAVTKASGNYDFVAFVSEEGKLCINVLFVRNGLVVGNKNYFPKIYNPQESPEKVLLAFVRYYYLQMENGAVLPEKIFLNIRLPQKLKLSQVFYKKFKRKIIISCHPKGARKQLMTMAEENATGTLKSYAESAVDYTKHLLDLKKSFYLSKIPKYIECFDVSHTYGEAEVASCVVFKEGGFSNKDYRRFNIKTTHKGDDYQALREAIVRRYSCTDLLPDLIIVDGGIGQLNVASQVLRDLNIKNITLISIAKGRARKPGLEEIYLEGKRKSLVLSPKSLAFRFIQNIRDEAHRFAITSHRQKMRKIRSRSELENISEIGKAKRILLLKHFGGLSEVRSAGIDDLAKVKGIGHSLAKRIYDHLHA